MPDGEICGFSCDHHGDLVCNQAPHGEGVPHRELGNDGQPVVQWTCDLEHPPEVAE